jgi:hypothetical protein
MVSIASLWLPIVLAAVIVFIASSVMHIVLTYHKADIKPVPNEDRVRDVVRGTPPGMYMFPHAPSTKELSSPAMQEKFTQGPVALLTVLPSGPPTMTKNLVQWFVFSLVVGLFVAYVTTRTVASGAEYLGVFRLAGTVAFLGYCGADATRSIWSGQPWGNTLRSYFDGLIYALLTAGVFAWLWPR